MEVGFGIVVLTISGFGCVSSVLRGFARFYNSLLQVYEGFGGSYRLGPTVKPKIVVYWGPLFKGTEQSGQGSFALWFKVGWSFYQVGSEGVLARRNPRY